MQCHRSIPRRAVVAGLGAVAVSACARPQTAAPPPPPPEPDPPRYADRLAEMGVGWAPPARGKAILVNVPSFDVVAFADGEPVAHSRAIVGAPRTPTPIGEVRTGVVRFRPTWRPTPRMIAEGLYEDGVRPPGPGNPLGLVAIRFDDDGPIYLHDTNRPALFRRERRALSAGCVRVEGIERLVAFVLDWSEDEALAAMNGRRTFDAPTPGVPIRLAYATRFAPPPGTPVLDWPDIYGRV